jgi:tripartite-type tricarboxylate transporter receptor subunit TctC
MKFLAHLLAGLALLCATAAAQAQDYPNRPLSLIVPFPAGGAGDVTARKMLPHLQALMKQPVIVDNVPGAGGSIGVAKMLKAPADGHVFMLGTVSDTALAPMAIAGVKYTGESVRLVAPITQTPFVLLARQSLPVNNIDELVAYGRNPANKGLFYGTMGAGSSFHLVAEDFLTQADFKMTPVPYRGLAPIVQDLMGGQVDLVFHPFGGNVLELVAAGKLKALGVTGAARNPKLAQVGTFDESRFIEAFHHSIWTGIFVSAQTSDAVVSQLHTWANDAARNPEFVQYAQQVGTDLFSPPLTQTQADLFYRAEVERFRKIARSVQLQPQ